MLPGGGSGHSTPGGAHEQALLDEERLVDILHGLGGLAHADGQGGQPHRSAAKALAQGRQDGPVDLVEPGLIDAEKVQPRGRSDLSTNRRF